VKWSSVEFSGVRERDWVLTLLVALIMGFGWFFLHASTPNERARLYLTHSVVEEGDISVDSEVRQWRGLYDLSKKDGRTFSNKPPGSSLMATVVYAPVRWAAPDAEWEDAHILLLLRFGFMLPMSLLGFLAFRKWLRLLDISEPVIDISSLAWTLGTAAFFYTTAFFSHHIIGVLFVVALWLMERVRVARQEGRENEDTTQSWWGVAEGRATAALVAQICLAGVALGQAGATEYQAGIPCALFAVYLVCHRELRHWTLLAGFAAGAFPFVIQLMWYHHAAFGSPWELTYFYNQHGTSHFFPPHWAYFKGLMFSLHRGLFSTGPYLLLAIPGTWLLWRRPRRLLAGFVAAALLWRIGFLSGYEWWNGDWGFGPRHMVSSMGLMSMLAAVTADRWIGTMGDWLVRGLAVAGVWYNQLINAFVGSMPLSAKNPVMDFVVTLWPEGLVTPNLVRYVTSLDGIWSLMPLGGLVMVVTIIILTRGIDRFPARWRQAVVVGLAFIPVVTLGGIIYGRGASFDSNQAKTWIGIVELWENYEQDVYEGEKP